MQEVLQRLSVTQSDMCRAIGISTSSGSRLVSHGKWPALRTRQVHERLVRWLAEKGAKPDELAQIEPPEEPKEMAPVCCEHAEAAPEEPLTKEPQEDPMLLRAERLTTEAKEHFGLPRSPFENDIATRDDVFTCSAMRRARVALMDAALNNGFVALVGESGSGKTTLREELEQRLLDENRPVIVIKPYVLELSPTDPSGRGMKAGQIIEAIITTLAPATPIKSTAQAKAKQAHDLLAASQAAGYAHLLIIEEAHKLPVATLKSLKSVMELKRGMSRLLGVALIGQPELTKVLSDQNPAVREIVQRCEQIEMPALDNDAEAYVGHKFQRMGLTMADVFTDDAMDAMRARLVRMPRGGKARDIVSICYPQVLNNLVVRAMNAAAEAAYPRVDANVIAGC